MQLERHRLELGLFVLYRTVRYEKPWLKTLASFWPHAVVVKLPLGWHHAIFRSASRITNLQT